MNPADKAQIEAAKFNAEMARRDAGNLMGSAAENARMFTTKGEQLLSQSVAILGKTGNLSTEKSEEIIGGAGLGARSSEEIETYRKELQKQLAGVPDSEGLPGGMKEIADTKREAIQKRLATLEGVDIETADIRSPEALLYASGSDLLTMVNTRDALERDKRTMIRNAQSEALSMLKAGEQYESQAAYAKQAANWNTWQTILGGGMKIAGFFT